MKLTLCHRPRALLAALLIPLAPMVSVMAATYDSVINQDATSPQVLEQRMQHLTWPQMQALINQNGDLKAAVDALGPLGLAFIQSQYTTFKWSNNISRWAPESRLRLKTALDQVAGSGATPPPLAVAKPSPTQVGKILREPKSGGTYVIDRGGLRRWVTSVQVFDECGLDWGRVETQTEEAINAIAEGAKLDTAEVCRDVRPSQPNSIFSGRLLKIASDARVYLIGRDGYRYWIANPTVFTGCGLDWGRIETLPPSQVFAITAGNPPGLNDARECAARR